MLSFAAGVHTALHHDTIMKSSDPDYVLVEAEATKASKSATRALKESRRHCREAGAGPGRATWTGRSGDAGAPPQHSSLRYILLLNFYFLFLKESVVEGCSWILI